MNWSFRLRLAIQRYSRTPFCTLLVRALFSSGSDTEIHIARSYVLNLLIKIIERRV